MGKWINQEIELFYKKFISIYENIIDILLPRPRFCNGCGKQLGSELQYHLCRVCQTHIHKYENVEQWDTALGDYMIACSYEGLAKELIYKVKYKDKKECAITIAEYMSEKVKAGGAAYDCIIPVPISARKLRKRGYNHAELIAKELGSLLNLPVKKCMIRIKDTKPQVLFNEQERWYNVKGCFLCNTSLSELRVLLIDDLITTGATAFYCSEELKKAGAVLVTSLAFARSSRF